MQSFSPAEQHKGGIQQFLVIFSSLNDIDRLPNVCQNPTDLIVHPLFASVRQSYSTFSLQLFLVLRPRLLLCR